MTGKKVATGELMGETHMGSKSALNDLLADFLKVFNDIEQSFIHDCTHWAIIGLVDAPKGDRQSADFKYFDHEYVNQRSGCEGDCVDGEVYLPFPGGKYLKIYYAS